MKSESFGPLYLTLCATVQDFHRKLMSLFVDNQLAEDYFADSGTVT